VQVYRPILVVPSVSVMALAVVCAAHLRAGSLAIAGLGKATAQHSEDSYGGPRTLPRPAGQKGLLQAQMSAEGIAIEQVSGLWRIERSSSVRSITK